MGTRKQFKKQEKALERTTQPAEIWSEEEAAEVFRTGILPARFQNLTDEQVLLIQLVELAENRTAWVRILLPLAASEKKRQSKRRQKHLSGVRATLEAFDAIKREHPDWGRERCTQETAVRAALDVDSGSRTIRRHLSEVRETLAAVQVAFDGLFDRNWCLDETAHRLGFWHSKEETPEDLRARAREMIEHHIREPLS